MRQFKPGQLRSGSLYPITASNAVTASYALNALTASYTLGLDTGSLVSTSSFNAFTASYTTGSFTGSFRGDGSQLTGIVSSKWTGSNPISRQSDVTITGSLRTRNTQGSGINTALGQLLYGDTASIDWRNAYLKDQNGITSIDWHLRKGFDFFGTTSINWDERSAWDSNDILSIDWETRQLVKSDESIAFDWENGIITGSLTVIGDTTITGSINTSGSNISLSADTFTLFVDGISILQAGPGSSVEIQSADGNASIDAQNRLLSDSNGNPTVNWESGYLYDYLQQNSIDWNQRIQYDQFGAQSIDYTTRYLIKSDGSTVAYDWENGYITASLYGTASWSENSQTASYSLQSVSSSYATIANSVTELDQDVYISGSLTVVGPATFYGTASFVSVTASNLFVSESFISVNVFEPVERFGGIKVYDSGSSAATASLAWDSLHNHWVYQNVSGSTYTGGMLLSGPRNTGSLGDEPNLTKWFVARSDGGDHLNDSQIFTSGSVTQVTGSLTVTAGITGSLFGTASLAETANITATNINNSYNIVFSQNASGPSILRADSNASIIYNPSTNVLTLGANASSPAGQLQVTGSIISTQGITGSLFGTASRAINATSASYAVTASYLDNYVPPFPFTGSAIISGSLNVIGDTTITGKTSINKLQDYANSTGSFGQILSSNGVNARWLTLKDTTQLQINSEGPTVTSGSKAYKFIADEQYIEKVTIRSTYTGSIQFIVKDQTTTYGSASLVNNILYEDATLSSWIRIIPSSSLLEFVVAPSGGISSGSASTFLLLINTLRKPA